MTLALARVTIKQHRFELAAATVAAVSLGLWALFVVIRTRMVAVPDGCFDVWVSAGPDGAGDCAGPIRAWGAVLLDQGPRIIALMAYLPFVIGLLGGIPIVARELESRTAQTAWSLNGSRLRWLLRQVVPIVLLLGLSIAFVAVTTSALEADRIRWGYSPVDDIGLHGPILVARAFGAFGLGVLVGALVGRTLPAFVLAAALAVALVFIAGSLRESWLAGLQPAVIEEPSANAVVTDVAWRDPHGRVLSRAEARAAATAAGVPPPAIEDEQDLPAAAWLEENGYTEVALGVTADMAIGWGAYDAAFFGLIGVLSLGGAILIVRRMRPT